LVAGGYAAGWLVPPGTTSVTFSFAPQQTTRTAQLVSLAVTGFALLLVVVRLAVFRRRERT
jgi:hypothetical protein